MESPPSSGWRFTLGSPAPEPAHERTPVGDALDNAWRDLLRIHMPFREVPDDERARLLDAFRQIERIFFDSRDPAMTAYYEEAYLRRGQLTNACGLIWRP